MGEEIKDVLKTIWFALSELVVKAFHYYRGGRL